MLDTRRNVLVTGVAGFIGYHVASALLRMGWKVLGIDNVNDYYSVELKEARLRLLDAVPEFDFARVDLTDVSGVRRSVHDFGASKVVHLGAQAGVRYSLENPQAYIDSNIQGFQNVLEACRYEGVEHLIYASSSSVYGNCTTQPFCESQQVDEPISLYAATKKSNELMAHCYSHLYGFATTGLRFFTVYGPWGRPDMAVYKFTEAIVRGEPVTIFNNGKLARDFTYIDDVVEGIVRILEAGPKASCNLYNIGRGHPTHLMRFVELIESVVGKDAVKVMLPMQPGDVNSTFADVSRLESDYGYRPKVSIDCGVRRFVNWYLEFHGDR